MHTSEVSEIESESESESEEKKKGILSLPRKELLEFTRICC